jgi:DNA-binding NarL/FixJ family response regulator
LFTNAGRAIIVEDDPSWQQLLSESLDEVGLEVDLADNLEHAQSILRKYPHRIAVVDLSLSGKDAQNQDGLLILKIISQIDPGCVAMLVTGYATVEMAVSVLTEKLAFTCLRKETFQLNQYRNLIQQALSSPQSQLIPEQGVSHDSQTYTGKDAMRSMGLKKAALVVDDDAGWLNILTELLTDADYQVYGSKSFGEAIGLLRHTRFKLAIIDLSLSKPYSNFSPADGFDIDTESNRLIELTDASHIPTIIVSGVANPDVIEQYYQKHDIYVYIQKQSFDRQGFLAIVNQLDLKKNGELSSLTDREYVVLELLAEGKTNKEIADVLVISTNTVKRHIKAIFGKLNIHTRSAAVAKLAGQDIKE